MLFAVGPVQRPTWHGAFWNCRKVTDITVTNAVFFTAYDIYPSSIAFLEIGNRFVWPWTVIITITQDTRFHSFFALVQTSIFISNAAISSVVTILIAFAEVILSVATGAISSTRYGLYSSNVRNEWRNICKIVLTTVDCGGYFQRNLWVVVRQRA